MKHAGSSILGWLLNGLCVVVLGLTIPLLARQYMGAQSTPPAPLAHLTNVEALRSVNWKSQALHLVMVLSVNCRYCTESAAFYRELLSAKKDAFGVVAILPEAAAAAEAYLKDLEVPVTSIVSMDLGQLGLRGTPTLMVADGDGRVLASWTGKLGAAQELEVAKRLAVDLASSATVPKVDVAALKSRIARTSEVVIVDVRARRAFATGHIRGAVSMPTDELEARAVHELAKESAILLYCDYSVDAAGLPCSTSLRHLRRLGFQHLSIVEAPLTALASAGLTNESSSVVPGASR